MSGELEVKAQLFPACAGMNRTCRLSRSFGRPVPRVRGDEPALATMPLMRSLCSPRARG